MDFISSFFLRAKHWKIFVLLVSTYLLTQIVIAILFPSVSSSSANRLKFALLAEASIVPFDLLFTGWLWSMGSLLYHLLKPTLRLNLTLFRVATIYTMFYFLIAIPLFMSDNPNIILPLHLIAMFFMFYILYFVSKSLVMKNKGRSVTIGEYVLYLFALGFAPFGVWLIQPRINQLYAEKLNT